MTIIHAAFAPSPDELAWARALIDITCRREKWHGPRQRQIRPDAIVQAAADGPPSQGRHAPQRVEISSRSRASVARTQVLDPPPKGGSLELGARLVVRGLTPCGGPGP